MSFLIMFQQSTCFLCPIVTSLFHLPYSNETRRVLPMREGFFTLSIIASTSEVGLTEGKNV